MPAPTCKVDQVTTEPSHFAQKKKSSHMGLRGLLARVQVRDLGVQARLLSEFAMVRKCMYLTW